MAPPIRAPSSAAHRVTGTPPPPPSAAGLHPPWPATRSALACRAAVKASGTAAGRAAAAGQLPCTGTSSRTPGVPGPSPGGSARATTSGRRSGLSLRWGDNGTLAVHRSPSHACCHGEPGSIRPGVSGKNASACPRQAAGRPVSCTASCWSLGATVLSPGGRSLGAAARAASKARPLMAVAPCTGRRSEKLPSSGMHSLRQTSQAAYSCTFTS